MSRTERIGAHTLILGDCREVMQGLGKFDAVVTDVPYEISQVSNGLRKLDYGDWDRDGATSIVLQTMKMLVDVPSVIAWCDWRQLSKIAGALPNRSERPLTWAKSNPPVLNGQYLFLSSTEHAFYGKLPGAWFVGGCIKSYWIGAAPSEREHPTQKPIWLMQNNVSATVPPNGSCFDPFMGSGTTGVACENLGRAFTGIEKDDGYFNIACRRVQDAVNRPRLAFEEPPSKPVQEAML